MCNWLYRPCWKQNNDGFGGELIKKKKKKNNWINIIHNRTAEIWYSNLSLTLHSPFTHLLSLANNTHLYTKSSSSSRIQSINNNLPNCIVSIQRFIHRITAITSVINIITKLISNQSRKKKKKPMLNSYYSISHHCDDWQHTYQPSTYCSFVSIPLNLIQSTFSSDHNGILYVVMMTHIFPHMTKYPKCTLYIWPRCINTKTINIDRLSCKQNADSQPLAPTV